MASANSSFVRRRSNSGVFLSSFFIVQAYHKSAVKPSVIIGFTESARRFQYLIHQHFLRKRALPEKAETAHRRRLGEALAPNSTRPKLQLGLGSPSKINWKFSSRAPHTLAQIDSYCGPEG